MQNHEQLQKGKLYTVDFLNVSIYESYPVGTRELPSRKQEYIGVPTRISSYENYLQEHPPKQIGILLEYEPFVFLEEKAAYDFKNRPTTIYKILNKSGVVGWVFLAKTFIQEV